jgi:hypothetical protein
MSAEQLAVIPSPPERRQPLFGATGICFVALAVLGIVLSLSSWFFRGRANHTTVESHSSDVLRMARTLKDGGGYTLADTGVPQDVVVNGVTVLRKSKKGTYCSGFTFTVAMHVAEERGLMRDKTPEQLKRFQKEWYGAAKGARQKQLVVAMEHLGIGREIDPLDAQPGDFIQFWTRQYGHSAVFLEWIKQDGKTVGFKFRSSQSATDGIGDQAGYFTSSGYSGGNVIPDEFFVGRLNP